MMALVGETGGIVAKSGDAGLADDLARILASMDPIDKVAAVAALGREMTASIELSHAQLQSWQLSASSVGADDRDSDDEGEDEEERVVSEAAAALWADASEWDRSHIIRTGLLEHLPEADALAGRMVDIIRERLGRLVSAFKSIYAGEHIDDIFVTSTLLHAILGKDPEAAEIFDFLMSNFMNAARSVEAPPKERIVVSLRSDSSTTETRVRRESWTRESTGSTESAPQKSFALGDASKADMARPRGVSVNKTEFLPHLPDEGTSQSAPPKARTETKSKARSLLLRGLKSGQLSKVVDTIPGGGEDGDEEEKEKEAGKAPAPAPVASTATKSKARSLLLRGLKSGQLSGCRHNTR